MTRSCPPLRLNSRSSSMIMRRPLHLINETSRSIRSQEAISFFSSENRLGSLPAPVNKELIASEDCGRTSSVLSSMAKGLFCRSSKANSCFAGCGTANSARPGSWVSCFSQATNLLTSRI